MRVAKFSALGFDLTDFRIHVHDLPEGYGIEGILGLNFLRNFDYEVRSILGQLRVDHASERSIAQQSEGGLGIRATARW